ncbi:MAG: hypothetical protein IPN15_20090 [Saprospiraceae bacterium]|nr:hypothetical protein [Candidatus Vicinibacter affinis]
MTPFWSFFNAIFSFKVLTSELWPAQAENRAHGAHETSPCSIRGNQRNAYLPVKPSGAMKGSILFSIFPAKNVPNWGCNIMPVCLHLSIFKLPASSWLASWSSFSCSPGNEKEARNQSTKQKS